MRDLMLRGIPFCPEASLFADVPSFSGFLGIETMIYQDDVRVFRVWLYYGCGWCLVWQTLILLFVVF